MKSNAEQVKVRQILEEKYHDDKYKEKDQRNAHLRGKSRAYEHYRRLFNNVCNKKILDFGCGDGWMSIELAKEGASVWGIDISTELLKKAIKNTKQYKVSSRAAYAKMAGEELEFENSSFDLVIGSAILHHVDVHLAVKEIFRVLVPGGKAIFIEPMNQNIALRVWRLLTPWRRSPTEKALSTRELKIINNIFKKTNTDFYYLISIFTSGLIIIFGTNIVLRGLNRTAVKFDKYVLSKFKWLGKYASVVVLELEK
jgi:2-polyprenyl-3-methyl-5-hydroxy-6-metoxy-1,4-benzoquinol methylase